MPLDQLQRPLSDLRISVTDRCNLRCGYCMPLDEYQWIDRKEILSFEEITRLARLLVALGVRKIRLTGGEPLLRRNLDDLVQQLHGLADLEDLSLTTNAVYLKDQAVALREAGLRRINVSLDSLQPERFRQLTRRGNLGSVFEGLFAAREAGLSPIKINMVVERDKNDDEIVPMLEFCRKEGFQLRYIEYMDVGTANQWNIQKVVPEQEILRQLEPHLGSRQRQRQHPSDPAALYRFADGSGEVGVIASVSQPFCQGCTRLRLTADGRLVTCLFATTGFDLKAPLRSGANDLDLIDKIASAWSARSDRFSEDRLAALRSEAGYDPESRRKLEMISLGG